MRASRLLSLAALLFAASVLAEDRNPADYPLRIHIFRRAETTFYYHHSTDEAKGEGRANLFENGEPKGVDFQFECSEKLQTSSGYETFPARWKKPNEELVVLLPEFGKPNSFNTCHFKVMMKDFAYYSHNGVLNTEPSSAFKAWMTKHEYDPEHGKSTPVTAATGQVTPAPAGTLPHAAPDGAETPAAPAASAIPAIPVAKPADPQ